MDAAVIDRTKRGEAPKPEFVGPVTVADLVERFLTARRRSEILSLRWDDVDCTAGVIRLRDSKTGPRVVSLTRAVKSVLDGIEKTPGSKNVIGGASGTETL